MSYSTAYLARNKHDLETLALAAKSVNGVAARVFFQLEPSEQRKSTSGWGPGHLVTLNLITESLEKDSLTVLDHEAAHSECSWCNRNIRRDSSLQELDMAYSEELLGNGPVGYQQMTDAELLKNWRTGHFWSALAKATRTEADHRQESRPQRPRTQCIRPGYVDSRTAIPDSSSSPSAMDRLPEQEDQEMASSPAPAKATSPPGSSIPDTWLSSSPTGLGSSSAFAPSFGDVNEDDFMGRSGLPEQTTVHLFMTFLQCITSCCLIQDINSLVQKFHTGPQTIRKLDIQARWDRRRSYAHLGESITIAGEDDGGLSAVALIGNTWRVTDPHIILFEGKKAGGESYYDDERKQLVAPISEKRLAQYLGEAITAWNASDGSDNQ
ncbi:hypothetical protein MAJ_10366, partial [Metarhizium majus ARSEF 297]